MRGLWVARLHISSRVAEKIISRHHLDPGEVRLAVECRSGLQYVWDEHYERGLRAIVTAVVSGVSTFVVLYPLKGDAQDDEYNLGSAYAQ